MKYVYTDEEKDKEIEKLRKGEIKGKQIKTEEEIIDVGGEGVGEKISGINIQRYKGLGVMNPDQLWDTTMNPENRILLRVSVEDVERADETFDILMGSDVAPRKKFIQTHAKYVKNLDV